MANSKRKKNSSNPSSTAKSQADRREEERLQEKILPWMPTTRKEANQFVSITTTGAWISIGILILFWVTVRFIGPSLGWWVLAG